MANYDYDVGSIGVEPQGDGDRTCQAGAWQGRPCLNKSIINVHYLGTDNRISSQNTSQQKEHYAGNTKANIGKIPAVAIHRYFLDLDGSLRYFAPAPRRTENSHCNRHVGHSLAPLHQNGNVLFLRANLVSCVLG